ncbi:uncharacterized protein J4E84_007955 [Alternaria hordeiaustralica]|uniref:uncharacterized protein n=1 Tax=Alternaria hordeiaustralica TaxID=1187925 RepID=UPI0020C372E3|nr:uncharacterized protein J4E84_007955 [Alternaria hordeiaustralica]KAI4680307.1 hypothetical protein J4E84_007955 [Alternaria hordeiaustralica]
MSTRFDNRQAILLDQLLDDPNLSPTPALLLNDKTLSLWLQDKIKEICSHDISGNPASAFSADVASIEPGVVDDVVVAWVNVKEACVVLETGWLILLQVLHLNQGNYRDGVLEKIIGQQLLALNNFQREMGTRKIMSKGDVDFMKELVDSSPGVPLNWAPPLKGARLGVPRNVINLMSDSTTVSMVAAFNNTLSILRSSGATILETDFPAAQDFLNDTLLGLQIMSADFVVNIESYLKQLTFNPHNISTLHELRAWTQKSPLESYPAKSTGVWDFALDNWNNTTPEFWQAYQKGLYYDDKGGLLGTIKRHGLDAVVLPSKFSWSFAAVAGAPVVSIPMGAMGDGQPVVVDPDGLVGSAPGIPFGFSFLGERWSDVRIVGLAYAMEQRTQVRGEVKPIVRPRTELGDVVGRK